MIVCSGFAGRRVAWILASWGLAAGVVSHALTYEACRDIVTSNDGRPDPGTPAAGYCNAVWHGYDWAAFALAGVLIAIGTYALLRFSALRTRVWLVTGIVATLAVANVVVASQLRSYFGA